MPAFWRSRWPGFPEWRTLGPPDQTRIIRLIRSRSPGFSRIPGPEMSDYPDNPDYPGFSLWISLDGGGRLREIASDAIVVFSMEASVVIRSATWSSLGSGVLGDSFFRVWPPCRTSLYRRAGTYFSAPLYRRARFLGFRGDSGLTGLLERAPIYKPFRVSSYIFKERTLWPRRSPSLIATIADRRHPVARLAVPPCPSWASLTAAPDAAARAHVQRSSARRVAGE